MSGAEAALSDLLSVPGLRGAIVFVRDGHHVLRADASLDERTLPQLVRGVGQLLRKASGERLRVELRYREGRFFLHSIERDLAVGLLTDERPSLPLLALALESLEASAADLAEALLSRSTGENEPSSEALSTMVTPVVKPRAQPLEALGPLGANEANEASEGRATVDAREPSEPRESREPRETSDELELSFLDRPAETPPAWPRAPAAAAPTQARAAEPSRAPLSELSREGLLAGEASQAMGELAGGAMALLGRAVVANYLREAMAQANVSGFEVRHDGALSALEPGRRLSPAEGEAMRAWASAFVGRCGRIVVDLPAKMLSSLSPAARAVVLPKAS